MIHWGINDVNTFYILVIIYLLTRTNARTWRTWWNVMESELAACCASTWVYCSCPGFLMEGPVYGLHPHSSIARLPRSSTSRPGRGSNWSKRRRWWALVWWARRLSNLRCVQELRLNQVMILSRRKCWQNKHVFFLKVPLLSECAQGSSQ